jgi:hypothetical protein
MAHTALLTPDGAMPCALLLAAPVFNFHQSSADVRAFAQWLGAGAVVVRTRLGNDWDWRRDEVPLDDKQALDIRKLEQQLGITVKGYWITDSEVDPSSLDKRAMQRRREHVVVSPGQVLWLDAKKPGELSKPGTLPGQPYASHHQSYGYMRMMWSDVLDSDQSLLRSASATRV